MMLWRRLIWCIATSWLFAASNSGDGVFVLADQDYDPAVSMTTHPNTQFCARIISPGQTYLNAGFFRFDDPLDCTTSPGAHGVNRTGEDGIHYVNSWGPCFDMTLDNTVNGWSAAEAMNCGAVTSPVDGKERTVWCYYDLLRKTFCAAFVEKNDDERPKTLHCGSSLDRTSGYFFDDLMNSTWHEVIYIKGGSCDSRQWENQDIMFEDMTDMDLEMYNEEFSSHLPCSFIHNHNVRVDDDRRTKMEFKMCRSENIDEGVELCAYDYPQEYQERTMVGARLEPLFGVSSVIGSEPLPYRAQRQEDDQVCIIYQNVIPNTYDQLACYSFCMNVGEETNVVMQGEVSLQIRFSDANKKDASFTKIDVEVVRRDNNGNAIDGTDDICFSDDDATEDDEYDGVGCYPLHSAPFTTPHSQVALPYALFFIGIMSLLVLCCVPSCKDRLSSRREDGYAEVMAGISDIELTEEVVGEEKKGEDAKKLDV